MSRDFKQMLAERVIVFDGAMGTRLYDMGFFLNRCFDELNLTAADKIEEVHRSYCEIGVHVIETNTFGANHPKLDKYSLADKVEAINEAGARIARSVAGETVLVAGAIGPLGIRIEPWGPTSIEEATGFFAQQAAGLVAGGVDLFSVETFFDLAEIEAAIAGIRQVSDLPIVAQLTLNDQGCSLEGVAPNVFGPQLEALDVAAIGVNCSVGPAAMLQAVEGLASAVSKPLIAQPNAGSPRVVDNRNIYLCSPEYMATFAKRMISLGVKVIGGCCGTTPEHLKEIVGTARSVSPETGRTAVAPTLKKAPQQEVDPVPLGQRSKLAAALDEGRFVTFVEMLPPRGLDLSRNLRGALKLKAAGIDAINIPDGPRATARMSPMALALQIERETDIETLMHYCCRDRNLLGMQSDLMGASALGLHNILVVTGDPPKLGDYPDATAVFDIDAIGLMNMVSRLNRGVDVGNNPIGSPTAFCAGVGADPSSIDLDREISRFEWKVDAGADFAITQPVFDVEQFLNFIKRIEHVRIPIIAGIWPLASYRNAEFMNAEIPEIRIPDGILARMKKADSKEAARNEGVAIAQEMLTALLPHIQGVQISAPFGRYQTALDVAEVLP
jgi:methionine synthase I (cobalamin-dependent)/5,10-methylenetetrahydrofolate reductase